MSTNKYLSISESYELKMAKQKNEDLSENLKIHKAQINELTEQKNLLENENIKLKEEKNTYENNIKLCQNENQKLKEDLQNQIKESQQKIDEKEKEFSKLKSKCDSNIPKEEYEKLKNENKKLIPYKEKYEKLNSAYCEILLGQENLDNLIMENNQTPRSLIQDREEDLDTKLHEIRLFKKKYEHLKIKNKELYQNLENITKKYNELKEKY